MKKYLNQTNELSLPERFFSGLSYFLFPEVCSACKRPLFEHEKKVCSLCLSSLPKTQFHLIQDNPIERIFWGRVPITSASAFLFFKRGNRTQKLMHAIKYREQPEVGEILGLLFGEDLRQSPKFSECKLVVPIPLHPDKFKARGYNQCDFLAQGIAKGLGAECRPNGLVRNISNVTQTKKKRIDRWDNVDGVFSSNREVLQGFQHILLVDDVVTTGATLESAANSLIVEGHSVSIATLAYADKR